MRNTLVLQCSSLKRCCGRQANSRMVIDPLAPCSQARTPRSRFPEAYRYPRKIATTCSRVPRRHWCSGDRTSTCSAWVESRSSLSLGLGQDSSILTPDSHPSTSLLTSIEICQTIAHRSHPMSDPRASLASSRPYRPRPSPCLGDEGWSPEDQYRERRWRTERAETEADRGEGM